MRRLLLAACGVAFGAWPAVADDWPMWGGRPDRNLVSSEKDLPTAWDPAKDVRWVVDLGTETFSNPVVAGGRVFIGTNNGKPRDPAVQGDRGILMCFSAADGTFLWQAVHDKLPSGSAEDWPKIGICSTPCVVGDRVYYVSNRVELVCADVEGFGDGENDGPFKDEARTGPADADFVWILDMRKELGVSPLHAAASSPLVVGDLVFVVTGQGVDEEKRTVKNPAAPSFIAVDRRTGKVAWQDASPGDRILSGQWGSPAWGGVEGRPQVAFPGGDGWLYAFEPETGRLIWKFNGRAHEKAKPDGKPETQNNFVATPVYAGPRILIAVGDNPENGDSPGCLRAIDARGRGDVTGTHELWRLSGAEFGCSISNVAVHEGLAYAAELGGFLNAVELESGKRLWRHDLLATVWGSPVVADGKIFLRTEDGNVVVFKTGREAKVLATNSLPGLLNGTVTPAGGRLYVAGQNRLYAVGR